MKICALVAEYNPLHNGHLKLINHIKNQMQADKLIVIMSGNFCERGEIAIMDKYTRAKHAVLAGADMVIELPTVFSVSNAEIFATGAVKILKSLGFVDTLCFGVESGDKNTYLTAAKAMLTETKEFKKTLKKHLETGVSLAKAKYLTVKELSIPELDEAMISSPNNILALEYTKAIIKLEANMTIEPFLRQGNHNDAKLYKNVTSAQSIRLTLSQMKKRKVKRNVPPYVYADLPKIIPSADKYILSSLINTPAKEIAEICDCTEGLENRIKALLKDNNDYSSLLEKVSTKRYTKARVRRIMLSCLLKINEDLIFKCFKSDLYVKVLAMSKDSASLVKRATENNATVLTRKTDYKNLSKTALECFEKDVLANDMYSLIAGKKLNEFYTVIL